jgi:hypothetical protein
MKILRTQFYFISKDSRGFIALLLAIFLILVMVGVGLAASFAIVSQYQVYNNTTRSLAVRVAAESGIEDALLKLRKGLGYSSSYSFALSSSTVTVEVASISAGSKSLTATAVYGGVVKKMRAAFNMSQTANVSFYYGAQVGEGGMTMGNGARVKGNVYANGSVIASNGTAFINNNIIVAKNGNRIEGLDVGSGGGTAKAYSCKNSTIRGDLTYVTGGTLDNCTVSSSTIQQAQEIPAEDLPIPQAQVTAWKDVAYNGGVQANDVTVSSNTTLGPLQIGTELNPKNLSITGKKTLKLRGTIYVTGDISICNQCQILLDEAAYGASSGVLLADGKISVENNAVLDGSGLSGSYLLLLSTNNSQNPASPAINVANNAEGAIFYSTDGIIALKNNMKVHEITGYKIDVSNSAEIEYESGLQNAFFSSGTGGSWEVSSWEELE